MSQLQMKKALLEGLRQICPCLDGTDELQVHETDWRGRHFANALGVTLPTTVEEVSQIVKFCRLRNIAIVAQGGNTGLCAGAVPVSGQSRWQLILSMRRMNHIRQVDPLTDSLTVEAGALLQDVQAAAQQVGRLFPLSLGAEGSCTIGGNISTNAGGNAVLRYGNTRDLVLGLEVVLASGEIWHGLRALRKDNAGYDLKHLFIGSEGTLGIVTAATLKLFPPLRQVDTALLALPSYTAALSLLKALQTQESLPLTAFELMSAESISLVREQFPQRLFPLDDKLKTYVLVEAGWSSRPQGDVFEQALERIWEVCDVQDGVVAKSEAHAASLWEWRELITEAQLRAGPHLKHDISLPAFCIPEFIEQTDAGLYSRFPGLRVINFGHLGDGNLHYNISVESVISEMDLQAMQAEIENFIYGQVCAMNGSFSAEHGIGQTKTQHLRHYRSATELSLMALLKRSLDPEALFNPGKVIIEHVESVGLI
ncbi:FAD-binding oxidoreductase [Chromobacterium vaccinii]|uniref:FAD-binding oxidoreductase n=1 Tax=Chromobacterium vaccinii TaxID=1108595 RepID=UPI001E521BA8|nr:FAD-binding oxidoreductase [Chromobacterium vaccinii]MCD4484941.1 FAD-binding oxidoreductase [Chromobacterium vaccinii]